MTRKEILSHAKAQGVPPDTIDKDWVLGHLLNNLFSYEWARELLVFKGGTCLRKCYFAEYRFSEDIDLTSVDPGFTVTRQHIEQLCTDLQKKNDIPSRIMCFDPVSYSDDMVGWNVEICYWGANHNPNDTPVFRDTCHTKVLLEIRHFEKIVFPAVFKPLIHVYSDFPVQQIAIPCYSIEEILSEKMRSLIQRNRGEARDYFDIWHIQNHYKYKIDWKKVLQSFYEKCAYKTVTFRHPDDFFIPERLEQVAITWNKRLAHQMKLTSDLDIVISDLKILFNQLFDS